METIVEATATQSPQATPPTGGYWDEGYVGALTTEEVERYSLQATQPET